jgi:LmbE family N-acetylglucosaminyl deacetylase
MTVQSVAVVVAHADDAELWAGGTLIKHRDAGTRIGIWYLYCGEERRRAEAETAGAALGSSVTFPVTDDSLRDTLADFKPDIVITHWECDSHSEHCATARRVRTVLPSLIIDAGINCRVFSCDTYNSWGDAIDAPFIPTDIIDISDVWQQKCDLLSIYESQPIPYFLAMAERQQRLHGVRTGVTFAEAFRQLAILGLARRHRAIL